MSRTVTTRAKAEPVGATTNLPQPVTVQPAAINHPDAERIRRPGSDMACVIGGRTERFNDVMMQRVAGTLWLKNAEGQDRERIIGAAFDAMAGFEPRDEVEGMMAAQAVALHNAAMECMRRAMLAEQPFELASRMRKEATSLSRAMVDMAAAIDKRRGKGQQTVRVEHVTVHAGGQAIVGAVTAPERLMGRGVE
jgi:hypothetical protein